MNAPTPQPLLHFPLTSSSSSNPVVLCLDGMWSTAAAIGADAYRVSERVLDAVQARRSAGHAAEQVWVIDVDASPATADLVDDEQVRLFRGVEAAHEGVAALRDEAVARMARLRRENRLWGAGASNEFPAILVVVYGGDRIERGDTFALRGLCLSGARDGVFVISIDPDGLDVPSWFVPAGVGTRVLAGEAPGARVSSFLLDDVDPERRELVQQGAWLVRDVGNVQPSAAEVAAGGRRAQPVTVVQQ